MLKFCQNSKNEGSSKANVYTIIINAIGQSIFQGISEANNQTEQNKTAKYHRQNIIIPEV